MSIPTLTTSQEKTQSSSVNSTGNSKCQIAEDDKRGFLKKGNPNGSEVTADSNSSRNSLKSTKQQNIDRDVKRLEGDTAKLVSASTPYKSKLFGLGDVVDKVCQHLRINKASCHSSTNLETSSKTPVLITDRVDLPICVTPSQTNISISNQSNIHYDVTDSKQGRQGGVINSAGNSQFDQQVNTSVETSINPGIETVSPTEINTVENQLDAPEQQFEFSPKGTVTSTKTVRKFQRIVTTRIVAKASNNIDAAEIKRCLEAGDLEAIKEKMASSDQPAPLVTTSEESSSSTTTTVHKDGKEVNDHTDSMSTKTSSNDALTSVSGSASLVSSQAESTGIQDSPNVSRSTPIPIASLADMAKNNQIFFPPKNNNENETVPEKLIEIIKENNDSDDYRITSTSNNNEIVVPADQICDDKTVVEDEDDESNGENDKDIAVQIPPASPNAGSLIVMESQEVRNLSDKEEDMIKSNTSDNSAIPRQRKSGLTSNPTTMTILISDNASQSQTTDDNDENEITTDNKDNKSEDAASSEENSSNPNKSLSKVVAFNALLSSGEAATTASIMEQFNKIAKQNKSGLSVSSVSGRYRRSVGTSHSPRYMSQPVVYNNRASRLCDDGSAEAISQGDSIESIGSGMHSGGSSTSRMIFSDYLEPVPDLEEFDPNPSSNNGLSSSQALYQPIDLDDINSASNSYRRYLRSSSGRIMSSFGSVDPPGSTVDDLRSLRLRNARDRTPSGGNSLGMIRTGSPGSSKGGSVHLRIHSDTLDGSTNNRRVSEIPLRRQMSDEVRDFSPGVSTTMSVGQSSPPASQTSGPRVSTGAIATPPSLVTNVSRSKSAASTLPAGFKRRQQSKEDTRDGPAPNYSINLPHSDSPTLEDYQSGPEDSSSLYTTSHSDDLLEKRLLIIQELINVELEYVKTLDILVNGYMIPLKQERILEDHQVDTIFYRIHEIFVHHAGFMVQLKSWENTQTVGDKIVDMFTRHTVILCYTQFIEKFSNSEKMLETCWNTKSSFVKFIALKQRESKSKLPLKALIVQPAQRIPRYELLIKRLLEYTATDSTDYTLLLNAEAAVHNLALKINAVREGTQDEGFMEGMKLLDRLLLHVTSSPTRQYIRHDVVSVEERKDPVCLFMFSDHLVFTTLKRKSSQIAKKPPVLRLQSSSGMDFVENIKYKVIDNISLDVIELENNQEYECERSVMHAKEQSTRKDLSILDDIESLARKLDHEHQDLDESLRRLFTELQKDMEYAVFKTASLPPLPNTNKLVFLATTKDGIDRYQLTFTTPEKRQTWENTVKYVKNQLASFTRTPLFYQTIQITRTRSGIQFSCAAPIDGLNSQRQRDVWICKSDGYTGHLCLLSLQPEPVVTLNTPLSGCNAKLSCIVPVPPFIGPLRRTGSGIRRQVGNYKPSNDAQLISGYKPAARSSQTLPASNNLASQIMHEEAINMSGTSSDSSSESSDSDDNSINANQNDKKDSNEEISGKQKRFLDPNKATMWLGAEDGLLFIYHTTDNVKTVRNRIKLTHADGIVAMLHLDNRVFISLKNGDLVMYRRDPAGLWSLDSPTTFSLSNQDQPIKRMIAVTGQLWCACQRDIIVVNPYTLKAERIFSVGPANETRPVYLLCCSGQSVWITLENSCKLFLYHATTYDYLCDVDIRHHVVQRLQNCDDIIQKHKEACLRITCLLVCKDLLWVGTSAGVILTIPTPKVTSTTTRNSVKAPKVESLDRGHTGLVRFMVAIESPPSSLDIGSSIAVNRRTSLAPCTTMTTRMKVISGGEGHEDFSTNSSSPSATSSANQNNAPCSIATLNTPSIDTGGTGGDLGRDDSVNHLQIWDVQ